MAANRFPATDDVSLGDVAVSDGKHEVRYTMVSAPRDGRPVLFRFEVRKRVPATSAEGPGREPPTQPGRKLRSFEFEVGVGDAEVVPMIKGPGGRRLLLTLIGHDPKTDRVRVLASLASARVPAILKEDRADALPPDPVTRPDTRPDAGPVAGPGGQTRDPATMTAEEAVAAAVASADAVPGGPQGVAQAACESGHRVVPGYDKLPYGPDCGRLGPLPCACPGCGAVLTRLASLDRAVIRMALGELAAKGARDDGFAARAVLQVIGTAGRPVDCATELVQMVGHVLERVPPAS